MRRVTDDSRPAARDFFWIFFLFLVQNGISYVFPGLTPPLLLIGVVFYALSAGPYSGLILGCFAGLFLEMFSVGKIGYQMAILGSLGFMSGTLSVQVFRESVFAKIFWPAVCNYLAALASLWLSGLVLSEGPSGPALFFEAFSFSQLLLTAVFSPVAFAFLAKVSSVREARPAVWR